MPSSSLCGTWETLVKTDSALLSLNFNTRCGEKQGYNETKSGSCMFHAGL